MCTGRTRAAGITGSRYDFTDMFVIISDVHSNLEALRAVVDTFPREGIRKIISVGDTIDYGADPDACIDMVKDIADVNVLGNHDAAVLGKIKTDSFNESARESDIWTRENLSRSGLEYLESLELVEKVEDMTIVHGTLHSPEDFIYMMSTANAMHTFEIMETQICFVGHSHVPGAYVLREGKVHEIDKSLIELEDNARYIVNAGSVGQPRDKDPRACYCLYDEEKREIEFRRVEYDMEAARKKIIDAGLPRKLGDRLLVGT